MTPFQCRVARCVLNWSYDDMEKKTRKEVSRRTVINFERGHHETNPDAVAAMRSALEATGVSFLSDGVNVRLDPKRVKS